jgi:hypothetical protein
MATERDFELLDNYLTNRLAPEEVSAFEQKLQADPDLKNEYNLQQKLVASIKNARVAELKAMLNTVPIPPIHGGGTSLITKLVIGTFVTALVATSIYLFFSNQEETQDSATLENTVAPAQEQFAPVEPDTEPVLPGEQQPTASTSSEAQHAEISKKQESAAIAGNKTTGKKKNTPESKATSIQPGLDVYDPSADTNMETPVSSQNEVTSTTISGSVKKGSSIAVEVDNRNKKYTFHYQLSNDKLQLYGPFEQNLYEIMEFFSDDKRTVFLYYKDGYYLLKENNGKITDMKPIKDESLIKKLKEYRKN